MVRTSTTGLEVRDDNNWNRRASGLNTQHMYSAPDASPCTEVCTSGQSLLSKPAATAWSPRADAECYRYVPTTQPRGLQNQLLFDIAP